VPDPVDAMMGREACDDLLVLPRGLGRDADPANGEIDEPPDEHWKGALVRVGDLGTRSAATPLLEPDDRLLERTAAPRRNREGLQRHQPESDVAFLFGDLVRGVRRGFVVIPHRERGEGFHPGRRGVLGEVESSFDPAEDDLCVGLRLPHRAACSRLECELRIEISGGAADVDRLLHRSPERLTVELEGVGVADLLPEPGLSGGLGLELERPLEQGNGFVDLVARERQPRRLPSPRHGVLAQFCKLRVAAGPCEVRVVGPGGFEVVVREQCCMLVVPLCAALEPGGEGSVEWRSLRLGHAGVGDLARERVLDRVLAFACDRGTDATTNEVTIFQQAEVGSRRPTDQLVDRSGPKDPPDHRGRLQRGLLVGRQ
jgi:hypothetical protein